MDQVEGEIMSGPNNSTNYETNNNNLMQHITNTLILAQTKIEAMQQAVAKHPRVSISVHGIPIPSLLDSSSEVTCLGSHTLINICCQI